MKAQGLTDDEARRLLIACAELPFLPDTRGSSDYIGCILETVLNFHMQVTVVEKALAYFRDHVQRQQGIFEHWQLQHCLGAFPDTEAGNKEAARFLWNNSHWTRVEYLRRLLAYFASIGVTDQPSLQAWTQSAEYERDFKGKVKGLGLAVYQWLVLRVGTDTIKPDVHVLNFVKRVVGRRLPEKAVVDLFAWLSPFLGQSMATLDLTIWYFERLGLGTNDSPALRVAFWNLLKAELEEKVRVQLLDYNWQVCLDDPAKLRYESAGLIITPGQASSGETVFSGMPMMLRQSPWNEGFRLKMIVRHDETLPPQVFGKLQERLADSYWEAANDPQFSATLDLEEDVDMSEWMTIDELVEKVAQILKKAIDDGMMPWQKK